MFNPSPFGWVAQYFSGFFFAYGVYLPFWSVWFKDQGVSATDIGLLVGIGLVTRCVANLLITRVVHRVEHLLPALRWLSFALLLFIIFHLFTGGHFWMLALATVLANLCLGPIIPLSDAAANHYAKLNLLDYGSARLWGSAAFVVGTIAVGQLVARYSAVMIVYTALFGALMCVLLSLRDPQVKPVTEGEDHGARPKLLQVVREWPVVKFLALTALIQGSHAAYYAFSAVYWKQAGYSEDITSYLWGLAVVAELGIFAFSKRLFAGWSLRLLFAVAAIGVMLRWGMVASTTSLSLLVLVQLLHGVTFATAHLAAVQYIQRAPTTKIVSLQALYNAVALGAFTALMTMVSGWVYDSAGASVMFWMMAAMGLLALLIKVDPPQTGGKGVPKAEPDAQI